MTRHLATFGLVTTAAVLLITAAAMEPGTPTSTEPETPEPTTAAPAATAGDPPAPQQVLLIKLEGATLPGARFSHASHAATECKTCHHLGRMDDKCSDCHKAVATDEACDAQTAFHRNCQECHREGGSAGHVAVDCMDCHNE